MCSEIGPRQDQDQEHRELVDDKYCRVLIQLREKGLFKKEEIKTDSLVLILCEYIGSEKRFRFLVEWDPTTLFYTTYEHQLLFPLHVAANRSDISTRQLVFEYGIRYFPKKKGINLMFMKRPVEPLENQRTPFQMMMGYDSTMKAIEDTLIRYSDTPINIVEALVMAAIDENIHLDGVYFLIRRQPDILQKLLSSSSSSSSISGENPNLRKRKDGRRRKESGRETFHRRRRGIG